jgi:hypothetical protein
MNSDSERIVRKRPWYFWPCVALGSSVLLLVGEQVVRRAMLIQDMSKTPYTGRQPIPWTREAWLASAGNCYDGNRYMMLDDLLAQHPLIGMTRVELEQLLGPLSRSEDGDPAAGRYCLGREPTWEATAIDPAWLSVGFDIDDRVTWIETPHDVYGN